MSIITKKITVKEEEALMPLTLEIVLGVLGLPERIKGDKLTWSCPRRRDSGNTYLKYDVTKKYFDCIEKAHSLSIKKDIIDRWKINNSLNKLFRMINKKDLKYKYQIYEEAGVKEYWVVFPQSRSLMIYTLSNEKYIASPFLFSGDIAESQALPGFKIDITILFASIPESE